MSNGSVKKIPALGFVDGVNVINGKVKSFKPNGQRIEVIIEPDEGRKVDKEVAALIGKSLFEKLKLKDGAAVYAEIHPLEVVIKPPPE